jgi:hypothetical protein
MLYLKANIVSKVRRTIISITPCKRSAARGYEIHPTLPELRSSSTRFGVEGEQAGFLYPELRYACTGLSKLNAYGVPETKFHSSQFTSKAGKISDSQIKKYK